MRMTGNTFFRTRVCAAVFIFILMLPLISLLSCSKKEPIRVGVVVGLTGRHSDLGISNRNGLMLGLEEINEEGGIHGRPIELLIRDDRHDPDTARAAVRELIRGDVVAILGHATSAMSAATYPLINEAKVVMLSATTNSSDFADKDDYFFMMLPSTKKVAEYYGNYVYNELDVRSVSIVYDLSNKSYAQAWNDDFARHIEAAGGRVLRSTAFVSEHDVEFGAIARKVLQSRPDAVMIVANALDTAMFCQQIRKSNQRVKLLTAEWAFTEDILKQGGAAVEGLYFTQQINLDSAEQRYRAFAEKYARRFGRKPDFAAISAYESMKILAEGLKLDPTRHGIKKALLRIGSFQGLHGQIRFDQNGEASRQQYIFVVKNNIFHMVK